MTDKIDTSTAAIEAMRKRDRDDLAEEEAILDIYKAALGMA